MQPHYSAKELAALQLPSLRVSYEQITRRARSKKWSFICQPIKGGYEKRYLTRTLPRELRTEIAARAAIADLAISATCEGATAGHEYAARLKSEQAIKAEEARITAEQGLAGYSRLPEGKKQIVDSRYEILKARDAFIAASGLPLKKGSQIFCNHYVDGAINLPATIRTIIGATLSWSSLNRWQQAHKKHGLAGLAPGYKSPNKGRSSVPLHIQRFILGLKADKPHIKDKTICEGIEARFAGETLPHKSFVRRFLRKWEADNASLLLYLENPDAWKNKHQFAFGSASEGIVRLNQMWEFDSTPADVMLTDGRHSILGVIDIYPRRLKLLVSPTSKATAVAALTRRAIIDWGVPEIAKTDNGQDYVSNHMTRVFASLGVDQVLCTPFESQEKPHIERVFRTFSHSIVELLPGYIGHNVADRKAIEARRSFASRMMHKESDPIEIKMTAAELQTLCDRWTEAIYHQNVHSGLGCSPAEMVRKWKEPVRRISDLRALDILLSEAPTNNGIRTVSKKGIPVEHTHFISPDLPEPGTKVRVLLDATDFGTIYVFDGESGEFICVATDSMRTGIKRVEIIAKAKNKQKKVMREGRKVLKKMGKEAHADTIYMEILEHREAQNANITPLPQPYEEYTSHALEEAAKAVVANDTMQQEQDEMVELLEEISQERQVEAAHVAKRKGKGIVPIFATMTERYQYIRDRQRSGGLSVVEAAFLNEFYQTRQGSTFMDLEGDLRKKYRFAEAGES